MQSIIIAVAMAEEVATRLEALERTIRTLEVAMSRLTTCEPTLGTPRIEAMFDELTQRLTRIEERLAKLPASARVVPVSHLL